MQEPHETTPLEAHVLTHAEELQLQQFLLWFKEIIIEKKTTPLEKLADVIGGTLAILANYPAIPLGFAFGKLIDKDIPALAYLFSTIAYIPTYILYNYAARGGLKQQVLRFSPHAKIFEQEFRLIRSIPLVLSYILAPFSAVPFMAYTKASLDNDLGTVIAVIIGFASTAAALKAESMIINNFFMMAEPIHLKNVRNALSNRIAAGKKSIKGMSETQLINFCQETLPLNKIFSLLPLPEEQNSSSSRKKVPFSGNFLIEILSFGMAAVAMAPLATGAKVTAGWLCNATGITNDDKEKFQLAVAVLAVFVNTLFCGYYAKNKFKRSIEAFYNNEFCPTPEFIIAFLFSMAASTMNAAIAEQSGNPRVFTFFSFIMATAMRCLAFEGLINECKRRYNNYCSPTLITTQQASEINMLDRLSMELGLMNPKYLLILEKITKLPDRIT